MKADVGGFLYPVIDDTSCSGCQKCVNICPVINPPVLQKIQGEPQAYAAWSLDEETRYNSTSGGIFTELAKSVLRQGGYVAGARYNDSHLVEHAMIDRMEDIPLLRQSKYVQSETKDIFIRVKTTLQTEKTVLFVGTPCQCAGLSEFLGKGHDNLILCDFICRGVNSPIVYIKYLEDLEAQFGAQVKQVWFKNKTFGWNKFCTKVVFKDGQEYLGDRDSDPFMYGYIKKGLNLYMRPSCGQCAFKGTARPVDITLADFWGIKLRDSTDNMRNGVSAVMLYTETGRQLWNSIRCNIYTEEHTIGEISPGNACLTAPAPRDDKKSKLFYSLLQTMAFSEALKKISGGNI